VKKHQRRQLKPCIAQMLHAQQCWAIHEPALASLTGLMTLGPKLDEFAIAAAIGTQTIGTQMADSAGIQMAGSVAVLPIFGVLQPQATWLTKALGWTSYEQLAADIRDAAGKAEVKAIILLVDSPGGSVLGAEEAAQAIYLARGSKPIYAFTRGMNASGAYWLSSHRRRHAPARLGATL
jgi:ClpP class serine protease